MNLTLPNGMILSGTVDEIKEFIDRSALDQSVPYQSTIYPSDRATPSTGTPYLGNMSYSVDYLKHDSVTNRFGTSEVDYDKPIHDKLKEAKNYERQFNHKN